MGNSFSRLFMKRGLSHLGITMQFLTTRSFSCSLVSVRLCDGDDAL